MEAQQETKKPDGAVTPTYAPGDRFSRYEIVGYIGFGAMSEVYEATHLDLQKPVALKLLRLERVGSQTARARFLREGRAAARLRHPGVVEIYDVGEEGGRPFLVMELLEGESLEGYLQNHPRLTPEQAVQLVLPIASAVQTAHEAGVLHRDLKPENVFLTRDGPRRIRPKIVDFGISSFLDADSSRLTMDSDILGTPQYMAPEQARGESLDGRADQYALAVMVYEMVTGRLPHERESLVDLLHAVAYEPGTPLAEADPSVPPSLAKAVDKALAYNREERFPSVREFALALLEQTSPDAGEFWREELSGSETVPTPSRVARSPFVITMTSLRPPEKRPDYHHPPPEKRPWLLMILLALLMGTLFAAGVWLFMKPTPDTPITDEGEPRIIPVHLRTVPSEATVFLDGQEVGTGEFQGEVALTEEGHELMIRAEGYRERVLRFYDQPPSVVYLSSIGVPDIERPAKPEPDTEAEAKASARDSAAGRRRAFRIRRPVPTASSAAPPEPSESSPESEPSEPEAAEANVTMRPQTPTSMTSQRPAPLRGPERRDALGRRPGTDNLDPWNR